jgi:hypothetical protein
MVSGAQQKHASGDARAIAAGVAGGIIAAQMQLMRLHLRVTFAALRGEMNTVREIIRRGAGICRN